MNIFKRKRQAGAVTAAVQTARGNDAFSVIDRYTPLCRPEMRMYAALRESIPVIDAAIGKIVRLVGGFSISCTDTSAKQLLEDFLKQVPCGPVSQGIESFIAGTVDRLLTYGTAIGEMVLDSDGHLRALYGADIENVELRPGKDPFLPGIYRRGEDSAIPHPERVLICALNPDADGLYGNSMLKGLPFVSGILLKIYSCLGTNFERMGNLRFAVTYRPSAELSGLGDNRTDEIAEAWAQAMRDKSEVRDFVAVGDVDIKVIGADNQMPEIEIPIRSVLEQIVAKTGLPPFLLGLCWSSTERMSAQQADILTSELEYYRMLLTPMIRKICKTYLRGEGYYCDVDINWNNISLQDEIELARARLYNAQAEKLENE